MNDVKKFDKGKCVMTDNSDVKVVLFPKIKNVLNQVFVKAGFSKGETSRLSSILMKENSDVSDSVSWDQNGFNKVDNWCSQYRYVDGNVNDHKQDKPHVLSKRQLKREQYRKDLRKRRMKWR